jgi:hypothetical protein
MHLWNVNGGAGFSVTSGELNSFTADATVNIEAFPIPEPATLLLMGTATTAVLVTRRPRRCGKNGFRIR